MSVLKSKQDYIQILKQRRDVGLPKAIANIVERKQTLETIHQNLLKEEADLQLEIEFWSGNGAIKEKSVFDIPNAVWAHMQTMFKSHEDFPRNICLASETLMELMTEKSHRKKLKHLGVQVFAVLAKNGYINSNDFSSCLRSNSKDLARFAAISWRHLKHNVAAPIVELLSSTDILEFMETLKGKRNFWEVFGGKCFRFNACINENSSAQKNYFATLNLFLRQYGKFIVSVDTPGIELIYDFHKDIFENIPELQYFNTFNIDAWSLIKISNSNQSNCVNVDAFYEFKVNSVFRLDVMVGRNYQKWSMKFANITLCLGYGYELRNVKELLLDTEGLRHIVYENILKENYACYRNVRKLSLCMGPNQLGILYVLNKFPNVREFSILRREFIDRFGIIRIPDNIDPPGPMVFPQITKFTLEMELTNDFLLPLNRVFEMFPSLCHFTLKCYYNKETLRANIRRLTANENFAVGQTIDLFLLYSEGRSLKDSNIWRLEKILKKIVIESVMEFGEWEQFPGQGVKRRPAKLKKEIYYRTRDGEISFDEIAVLL